MVILFFRNLYFLLIVLLTGMQAFASEQSSNSEQCRRAMQALSQSFVKQLALTEREIRVLELRYGLNGERILTLREAGQIVNVSGSRVGQIESQALKKLDKYHQIFGDPSKRVDLEALIRELSNEEHIESKLAEKSEEIRNKEIITSEQSMV